METKSIYESLPLVSTTSIRLLRWGSLTLLSLSKAHLLAHRILLTTKLLDEGPQKISCELYVDDLSLEPQYTALSYMWVDPSVSRTICVDGKDLQVRDNLFQFLVRESEHSGCDVGTNRRLFDAIWIDAICIDQTLSRERNHQVSIMGQIYSQAKLVVSWLGYIFDKPNAEDILNSSDTQRITNHEYWSRVCILQEVVLAKVFGIWTNYGFIDLEAWWESGNIAYQPFDMVHVILTRRRDRRCKPAQDKQSTPYRLADLLRVSSNAACTDPRDRLFAILSLLTIEERDALGIVADYSKSQKEVLHDAAKCIRKYASDHSCLSASVTECMDELRVTLRIQAEVTELKCVS